MFSVRLEGDTKDFLEKRRIATEFLEKNKSFAMYLSLGGGQIDLCKVDGELYYRVFGNVDEGISWRNSPIRQIVDYLMEAEKFKLNPKLIIEKDVSVSPATDL